MDIKFIFLWTDFLLYLLIGILIFFVIKIIVNPLENKTWRYLLSLKRAQISLFVLLIYGTIGLLDSIHFQEKSVNGNGYDTKVVSVLDKLLAPMGEQAEKTYSAPLAVTSFSRETIQNETGQFLRVYPLLTFAGSHLKNPQLEYKNDIKQIIFKTSLTVIITTLCLILFFYYWLKSPSYFLLALLFLVTFLIISNCIMLSQHYHVLGTDKIGEDVLYQCLKSIRTGLLIGTLTTLVMLPFALVLGALAGYMGGIIDDVIQYIYTTLSSIPGVLLIAAMVLTLQIYMMKHTDLFPTTFQRSDARLLGLCLILGITSWTSLCRLIRAETLKLRELDYISAAKSLAVPNFIIIMRHILPNVLHIVLIIIALDFSGLVLAEAVLSYVGVGVDPTTYSWGNMINSARLELARDPVVWWSLIGSFSFMFILVLFANIFADCVRDAFDPKVRV